MKLYCAGMWSVYLTRIRRGSRWVGRVPVSTSYEEYPHRDGTLRGFRIFRSAH